MKKRLSENAKVNIFRWWFAGAVYFMVAWATPVGSGAFIDMVVILGMAMGLATVFLFNPIVYGMFDIKRNGRIVNQKYYERSVGTGVLQKLMEAGKCLLATVLVALTYHVINTAAIGLLRLGTDSVVLAGEPILFATLFLIYYNTMGALADKASRAAAQAEERLS